MTEKDRYALFTAFGFLLGIMTFCAYEHWMAGVFVCGLAIVGGFIVSASISIANEKEAD